MKRVIVACSMMENELKKVYKKVKCTDPIVWLERGYHNSPDKLRKKLQETIDSLQEYDEILLAYGLCGNGTAGVYSEKSVLVLPKFDDCINLMLCNGIRQTRGLTKSTSIYLTDGWIRDEEAILQKYEDYIEQYDQETADEIMEMMYEHYEKISIIDTKSYDLKPVQEYADRAAQLLNLETEIVDGSIHILEQLLLGEWDSNFIVQPPQKALEISQWDYK